MSAAAAHDTHAHAPTHHGLLAPLLALDAVLHADLTREAVDAIGAHLPDADVARVLDVGAGRGAGAFALAARYPHARVVAVDVDEASLAGVRHRAYQDGVADRVAALRADVAGAGFDAGTADVAWSANAVHEVADPATAFANLFRSVRPGGVLVVVEMDSPPHLLPQELAPLERALRVAAGSDRPGPDWRGRIVAAGFDLLSTRTLSSDQHLPADGPAGEYAALELRRVGHAAAPRLDEADRAALRQLAGDGPGSVRELSEVRIRSTRTLWTARRP